MNRKCNLHDILLFYGGRDNRIQWGKDGRDQFPSLLSWMLRDDGEDTWEEKDLVRGYTFAEYHADVYDRTEEEVTDTSFLCFDWILLKLRSPKLDWTVSAWGVGGSSTRKLTNTSRWFCSQVQTLLIFPLGVWLLDGVWEGEPSENCGDFEETISWIYNWLVWRRLLIAFSTCTKFLATRGNINVYNVHIFNVQRWFFICLFTFSEVLVVSFPCLAVA